MWSKTYTTSTNLNAVVIDEEAGKAKEILIPGKYSSRGGWVVLTARGCKKGGCGKMGMF
jgi:hypothetical protein